MKLTVKLQDGQLKASASADFEQSILNLQTVHGYGSCLASIAMDTLFNAMGSDGPDDGGGYHFGPNANGDQGPPDEPDSRLPGMAPNHKN